MFRKHISYILTAISALILLAGCANNKIKSGADTMRTYESSDNSMEHSNDSILATDQLIEYSTDTIPAAIVAEIDNKIVFISKENYECTVLDLKRKLNVKGVAINNSGEIFILKPSDVYLKYDSRGTGLNGNYIKGRNDFKDLPTKEEAEAIISNIDVVQNLLEIGGMSPLKGKYWTQTIVHDENEHVLNYGSYWIFINGDKPVVTTQQTINDAHLRLVERIL